METTIKTVPYKGWKNNLQLANGDAELTITLDVGPRVISYRLTNGPNVFKEWEDQLGKSGESDWIIRGGHRLWRGPEDEKLTYVPDNTPLAYEQLGPGSVRLMQPVEEITGISASRQACNSSLILGKASHATWPQLVGNSSIA